ncbi:MAG: hypothetical protein M3Q60_18235 [Actinomycetota bacterium]|nr:hypothetical protein [Actinomycetota bacterium]
MGAVHRLVDRREGRVLVQGFYFSKPLPGGAASALPSANASPKPSGLPIP